MADYIPEKFVWDNSEFENMGWHDATLWGMHADSEQFEYLLDLDYIFKWVDPIPGEHYFQFWIAPVTMVFENVADVRMDIQSRQGDIGIADLHRDIIGPTPNGKLTYYGFRFECQEGTMFIQATNYKMYVRKMPSLMKGQSFSLAERGGISFAREDIQGRLLPETGCR